MICKHCGGLISDFAERCPICDAKVTPSSEQYIEKVAGKSSRNVRRSSSSGSFGYGLLGFFIPLVGIVLYFAWKDTRYGDAKAALKGAIITLVIAGILTLITSCSYLALLGR